MGAEARDEQNALPPRLTSRQRRESAARGQRLKASVHIGRQGVTTQAIDGIRQAFANTDLIKVRVDAEGASEVDAIAEEIAQRVPCQFVQRVGRVVLLQRPREQAEAAHDT